MPMLDPPEIYYANIRGDKYSAILADIYRRIVYAYENTKYGKIDIKQ
jgi:hypothetical protein